MVSIIKDKTVKDFILENPTEWIYVKDTAVVNEVINTLATNHVQSVPVISSSTGRIIGIVDVLDLVAACVSSFPDSASLSAESFSRIKAFVKQPVTEAINFSTRDAPVFVFYQAPLSELIAKLANPNTHRVVVVNEVQDGVGLVTQSKIVEYLYSARAQPELKEKLSAKLRDWMPSRLVESVSANDLVISAFRKIYQHGISGLAVVNKHGKLVGNISASDIKVVHLVPIAHFIHELYQPIKHFKRMATKHVGFLEALESPQPVYATATDTVEATLQKIVEHKIHRIYVVDEQTKPVGVVALSDLIHWFTK